MPSPNFDRICVELSRRIGDPVTTASSTASKVLTAAERDAYVNKAMHKLVGDIWLGLGGDEKKFIEIFPELYDEISGNTAANGTFDTTSSYGDFFKLIDGYKGSTYIKTIPKYLANIVKLGINAMYVPSATNYFMYEKESVIYFLPATEFNVQAVNISYVKKPTKSDGSFYSNGDTSDIPFYPHWNSKIAEIAEELVRIDRQYQN